MSYRLFLDDIRIPLEVSRYVFPFYLKSEYIDYEWVVVRSYADFVKLIEARGLPTHISFDHDLADEHYRLSMYNPDEHYSNYYADGTFEEKTGYDAAKWLAEYCMENQLELPVCWCHSMNPIGKKNILNLLENYQRFLIQVQNK